MRAFASVFSALILTVSLVASASLKDTMKEIGEIFGEIAKTSNERSSNAKNAAAAAKLITLFRSAQSQVPKTIKALPATIQGAAIADYQRIMQREIEGATALVAAFNANDNAQARRILQAMAATKKEGHDKYDPQTGASF